MIKEELKKAERPEKLNKIGRLRYIIPGNWILHTGG